MDEHEAEVKKPEKTIKMEDSSEVKANKAKRTKKTDEICNVAPKKKNKPIKTENSEVKEEKTEKKRKKSGRAKEDTICEVCQKPMRSRYHLKLHMAVHTGEKTHICPLCQKGFQQKWNLITHMGRVHSKEKPFKCSECGKAYGYSSHFKRHVKTHFLEKIQAPDVVKRRILNPFKCEFCEKSFDSTYRLDIHMRKHTGEKPFACDQCGKCFTTRRLITVHMKKKHDVEYDFICEHCGECFPDQSAILLHLKTGHKISDVLEENSQMKPKKRGNKPSKSAKELIPCEVCGKTISREAMNKHLNIHYRNRLHKCRYCSKEFLESSQRMVHERKHTGEKPYLCDVCGKAHSQYGNLLAHRKKHHNLTGKPPKTWKSATEIKNEAAASADDVKPPPETETDKAESTQPEESAENVTPENSTDPAKPPYTGDETIEQFLQIANNWINKKFEESKPPRRRFKLDGNEEDLDSNKENFDEESRIDEVNNKDSDKDCSDKENAVTTENSTENANKEDSEDEEDDLPLSRFVEKPHKKEDFQVEINIKYEETYEDDADDPPPLEDYTQDGFSDDNREAIADEPETKPDVQDVKKKISHLIYEKILSGLKSSLEEKKKKEILEKLTPKKPKKFKSLVGKLLRAMESLDLMESIPDNDVLKKVEDKLYWHCWMCNSKFHTRHLLARHLLVHEPEENRPYKCEKCGKRFTQSNNYKEHVMSHNNEHQYYCDVCGSGFRHKTHFNIHMSRHRPDLFETKTLKYGCSYCSKRFRTNFIKEEHERTHTKEKPYLCKVCGKQFGAMSTLRRHLRVHNQSQFQCPICLKFFVSRFSLKRHMNTHSSDPSLRAKCECGQTFSQKPALAKHKIICELNEGPIVRPFPCSQCSKAFLAKSDLKRHMSTHALIKTFKCDICSTVLKTPETYRRHLRRHQRNPDSKPEQKQIYSCEHCDAVFNFPKSLRKHVDAIHLDPK